MNTSHISAVAQGLNASGGSTTNCHNLRPVVLSDGTIALIPVDAPAVLADGELTPLAAVGPADSSMVVVADGDALRLVNSETGDAADLGQSAGEYHCAVASDNHIAVSTDQGIDEYSSVADDLWFDWLDCDSRNWPALSMIADEGADCSSTVEPRKLKDDYTSVGTPLSDADRRAVSDDLKRAYADVASQAAAQGACCAPMMMRYRLVGHDGDILFTSPPLLLGASDSAALTAPIAVTSADRRTLDSYTVAARAWRLRLLSEQPLPGIMAASIGRIEIVATPQFHPFDPDGEATVNLVWRPADTTMMRLTMPGAGRSVSSGNSLAGESRLRRMLSVMPSVERVVATVQGPFIPGEVIDVTPSLLPVFGGLADECKAVENALGRSPDSVAPKLRQIAWPHRFSARCGASAAGSVLWGGLTAHRFDGFGAKMFAASGGCDGPWHAAVSVTFASGDERVVAVSEGTGGAPVKFNPLVGYPSPDAVSMTIIVSAAGEVHRRTVPLSPDPSGSWSVYVDRSFAPFALTDEAEAFVVPPEVKCPRPMPGCLALASESSPSAAKAVATVGDAAVCSLFAASRSQSSWDFSKVRFSALTSAGVYTVTVDPTLQSPRLSVNLIDSRSSPGSDAAVLAADRTLAILEDALVEVGVSRCKTLLHLSDLPDRQASLAHCVYDSLRREVWLSGPEGSTVVRLDDLQCYTRDETASHGVAGRFALIDGKLADLHCDSPRESVYVRWRGSLSAGRRHLRPKRLAFDMRSPSVTYGQLTVSRASLGDTEPHPSLRLNIDGAVGSPIVTAFPALPLRSLRFSFQGRVDPSTLISNLLIEL